MRLQLPSVQKNIAAGFILNQPFHIFVNTIVGKPNLLRLQKGKLCAKNYFLRE